MDRSSLSVQPKINRRAVSMAPSTTDRMMESFREDLEERCKENSLPPEFLSSMIQIEQTNAPIRMSMTQLEKDSILRRLDKLLNYTKSPCLQFLGDSLLVSMNHKLKFQRIIEKELSAQINTDQLWKDIQSRKSEIEKYNNSSTMDSGYYSLNNFVARDHEIVVRDQAGLRLVATHIWNYNFQQAQAICKARAQATDVSTSAPGTKLQFSILRPILKGFANLQTLIKGDPQLQPFFYKRKTLEITVPSQIGCQDSKVDVNILCCELTESNISSFRQQSVYKKVSFLREKLQFLIEFAGKYRSDQYSPYFNAIMQFLGNSTDRSASLYQPIINAGIWLVDQFIFAQKYLSTHSLNSFKAIFKTRIEKTSNLINISLCTTEAQKKCVLQNYLDSTSDLETVAILAINEKNISGTNMFDMYIRSFKDVCQKQGDQPKLQQVHSRQQRAMSRPRSFSVFQNQGFLPKTTPKNTFFLRTIDFKNKKILSPEPIIHKDIVCSICTMQITSLANATTRKQAFDDYYIECLKCKHGGHSKHMLSWYQKNQRCPKSDCVCLCN